MSWRTKHQDVLLEMNHHKIDVCAISESKRKGKGTLKVPGFVLVYSGVEKQKRATAGDENNIDDIHYVNERIARLSLQSGSEKFNILSVYAPDISRKKKKQTPFMKYCKQKSTKYHQMKRY